MVFPLSVRIHFSPAAFKAFSLSLCFQKFYYDVSWSAFFGLIVLGICSASQICRFMSFTNFGKFFSALPSFSSPSRSPMTQIDLFYSPTVSLVLLIFFTVCFLSVVQIGWFLIFYLQVHWFFSLRIVVEPIHWVF